MNDAPQDSRSEAASRERWELADRAATAQAADRHGLSLLAAETGRPVATLRRWAWVARRYPPETRRLKGLGFAHHEAAAASVRRFELVDAAEKLHWSVSRMRMELAAEPQTRQSSESATRRGPQCLDEAAAYMAQLTALKSSVAEGVRERVTRIGGLADTLGKKWNATNGARDAM